MFTGSGRKGGSLEDVTWSYLNRQTKTSSPVGIDGNFLLTMHCWWKSLWPRLQITTPAMIPLISEQYDVRPDNADNETFLLLRNFDFFCHATDVSSAFRNKQLKITSPLTNSAQHKILDIDTHGFYLYNFTCRKRCLFYYCN